MKRLIQTYKSKIERVMLGVRVQTNPTLPASTPSVGRDIKITHIGRRPSERPRGLRSHPSALRVWKRRWPAPEAHPRRGPSRGAGSGPYSPPRHGFGDHPQLQAQKSPGRLYPEWERVLRCWGVHLFPCFLLLPPP